MHSHAFVQYGEESPAPGIEYSYFESLEKYKLSLNSFGNSPISREVLGILDQVAKISTMKEYYQLQIGGLKRIYEALYELNSVNEFGYEIQTWLGIMHIKQGYWSTGVFYLKLVHPLCMAYYANYATAYSSADENKFDTHLNMIHQEILSLTAQYPKIIEEKKVRSMLSFLFDNEKKPSTINSYLIKSGPSHGAVRAILRISGLTSDLKSIEGYIGFIERYYQDIPELAILLLRKYTLLMNYEQNRFPNECVDLIEKSIGILLSNSGWDNEDIIQYAFYLGYAYYVSSKYQQAEATFLKVISLVQKYNVQNKFLKSSLEFLADINGSILRNSRSFGAINYQLEKINH